MVATRNRFTKITIVIFGFALVLAAIVLIQLRSSTTQVKLGAYSFEVPGRYMYGTALNRLFMNLEGADESAESIHIKFSGEEISSRIPQFQRRIAGTKAQLEEEITVIVSGLSDANVRYVQSSEHYSDMWRAEGQYSDNSLGRSVEFDNEYNLYKVSFKGFEDSWIFTAVDLETDLTKLPPGDSVIAHCRSFESVRNTSFECSRAVLKGNLQIEYGLTKENFALYTRIDEFIFDQLEQWKVGTPNSH